jgi:hypothetical protein
MEADWEVEVGGGAPVIEALWPGFVDLRRSPERMSEIAEAVAFPALGDLLQALNGAASPLWTAKCDVWEADPADLAIPAMSGEVGAGLACYVDLLPVEGQVFAEWVHAEGFCREWVAQLELMPLTTCRVDLIVRQTVAGAAEGFGVTAYLAGTGGDRSAAAEALKDAMAAFAGSIPAPDARTKAALKLQ